MMKITQSDSSGLEIQVEDCEFRLRRFGRDLHELQGFPETDEDGNREPPFCVSLDTAELLLLGRLIETYLRVID